MEIERVAFTVDSNFSHERLSALLSRATVTVRDENEELIIVGPLFMFPTETGVHGGLVQQPEKQELPPGWEPRSLAEAWAMSSRLPAPRLEWVNPIVKPFVPKFWELPVGVICISAWSTSGDPAVWYMSPKFEGSGPRGITGISNWVVRRNDSGGRG